MKNKKTMSVLALGMIALLGVSLVAAYQGDSSVEGPNYSEDRHTDMQAAFASGDYEAWAALMAETGMNSRVMSVVDADNFGLFAELHETTDPVRIAELKAELGLGNGSGAKDGSGFGGHKGMKQGSMQDSGMKGQGSNGDCLYAN